MGKNTFLDKSDIDITTRESAIKGDGWKVDQNGKGNCGIAATLMAIMDNFDDSKIEAFYDALKATVYDGTKFGSITNSDKIKARVGKRYTSGYAGTPANNLDYDLCVGMMILLKEHLRNHVDNGKEKWDTNLLYSHTLCNLTGDSWSSHPLKAKDVTVSAPKTGGLNSKNGDIGLTVSSMTELLGLMGFKTTETLIDANLAKVKANHEGSKWEKTDNSTVFSHLKTSSKVGAIVGVAFKGALGKPDANLFDYVAHWVYLPKSQFGKTLTEAIVWNWGVETNLTDIAKVMNAEFVAVKLLELEVK